ncbi:hypothetical protein BCR44DRAFT_1427828 [Catenaria anguillulae PL171]|uniref:Uncharacterized protein n=1 Tax=Catenaria anguillulae PL171 TaxID=765915 RepID=A0A1Y2HWB6_9FUNG|nr:hypothetical protein BCR44DRAFT_1427828 [Catenaria anguillulae PL171]
MADEHWEAWGRKAYKRLKDPHPPPYPGRALSCWALVLRHMFLLFHPHHTLIHSCTLLLYFVSRASPTTPPSLLPCVAATPSRSTHSKHQRNEMNHLVVLPIRQCI